MEDFSPYEQPTMSVAEQEPVRRFRDLQGITRFLQFVLTVYGCLSCIRGLSDLTYLSIASNSYTLWNLHEALMRSASFSLFFMTARFIAIPTLCIWLWLIDANQRALRRAASHHAVLLVIGSLCILDLEHVRRVFLRLPLSYGLAALAVAGTGYLAWFMYRALQSTSSNASLPRSFRLWCAAVLAQILVPLWLRWIYTRTSEPDDLYLSSATFNLLAMIAVFTLMATAGRLAYQQRLCTQQARVTTIGD